MIDSASWKVTAGSLTGWCMISVSVPSDVALWPDGRLYRGFGQFSRCVARTSAGARCRNELELDGSTAGVIEGGISLEVAEVRKSYDGDWEAQLCRVHAGRPGVETVCAPEREPYEVPADDLEAMAGYLREVRQQLVLGVLVTA